MGLPEVEGPARSADGGRNVRRLDRAELRRRLRSRLPRFQSPLEASIAEPESAARGAVIAKVHVACVLRPGPSVPRRAPVGGSCIAEIVTRLVTLEARYQIRWDVKPGGLLTEDIVRHDFVTAWFKAGVVAGQPTSPGGASTGPWRSDARHRSKRAPLPNLTGGKSMNILVGALTIGALVIGVLGWRSQWTLLRRLLIVAVLLIVAYTIAWVGAGIGRLPSSWVTDHPIAVIGAWSLAVLAVVGPLTLSRPRAKGRGQSVRQA